MMATQEKLEFFTIERGVRMPLVCSGCGSKYQFCSMEVGDSFALPSINKSQVASAAWNFGKRHDMKFSMRKQSDDSYRIWRVA